MKAILTYHSLDDSGSPVSLPAATFRRHIEWLAREGPPVLAVDDLLRLPHDAPGVTITFDDAMVNFATHAWPLLRAHAMPVTLFIPTACVGGTNAWSATDTRIPELPIMAWRQIESLVAEGLTPGSHTRTHPYLSRVSDAQLEDEIAGAASELETRLGVRPAGLAYPFGDVDGRITATAARWHDHACTTELRGVRRSDHRHRLPRIDAYYLRGRELEWWGTPRLELYIRARAGARECRRLLTAVVAR